MRTAWALRALLGVALLLATGACSDDRSFVLVSVFTTSGEIKGFASLEVALRHTQDGRSAQLDYPRKAAAPVNLTATAPVTFSTSFSKDLTGTLELGVIPLDVNGAVLGFGKMNVVIKPENVAEVEVRVDPNARPPADWPRRGVVRVDAGAPDVRPSPVDAAAPLPAGPSPGGMEPSSTNRCDLVAANTCASGGRCVLACLMSDVVGTCAAGGGTKQPGQACENDGDCAAGTQCFSYGCGSSVAKICGRTCSNDGACGGSKCFTPISCAGKATAYRICSNTCDPTGTAATGCESGLRCILDELGFTECRCVAATRVQTEGGACTVSADCQVGLTCVSQGGRNTCRRVCRLGQAGGCPQGFVCSELGQPAISPTYGFCEP